MRNKYFYITILFFLFKNTSAQNKYDSTSYFLGKFNIGIDCISALDGLLGIDNVGAGLVLNYQITPYTSLSNTICYYTISDSYYNYRNGNKKFPFSDLQINSFNWGANLLFIDSKITESKKQFNASILYGFGLNYCYYSAQYKIEVSDFFNNTEKFPTNKNFNKITASGIGGICFILKNKFRINFYYKLGINNASYTENVFVPVKNIPGAGYDYKITNSSINLDLLFKLF